MGSSSIAAMNSTVEASVDLAVPVFRLRLDEALPKRQTSVVDQYVEPAEIPCDGLDHGLDCGEICDVGLVDLRFAALRGNLGDQRFGVLARAAVIDRDGCTFGSKTQRDLAADTAACAGHQCNSIFQPQIHVCSFMFWPALWPLR